MLQKADCLLGHSCGGDICPSESGSASSR